MPVLGHELRLRGVSLCLPRPARSAYQISTYGEKCWCTVDRSRWTSEPAGRRRRRSETEAERGTGRRAQCCTSCNAWRTSSLLSLHRRHQTSHRMEHISAL